MLAQVSLRSAAVVLLVACAAKQSPDARRPSPTSTPAVTLRSRRSRATEPEPEDTLRPMVPAEAAYAHGWMPLSSTGVDQFAAGPRQL